MIIKEDTSAHFEFDPNDDPKKTLARARRLRRERWISESDYDAIKRRVAPEEKIYK